MPPRNQPVLLPLTRLLKPQLIKLVRNLQLPENGRVVDLRSRIWDHLQGNPALLDIERYANLLPNHDRPPRTPPPGPACQTPLPHSVPHAHQPGHNICQGIDRDPQPWNGINNPPSSGQHSFRGRLPPPPINTPQNLFHRQPHQPLTSKRDQDDQSFVLPPLDQPLAQQNAQHANQRSSMEPNDSKSLSFY
jgi:hypothetical protein